MTSDATFLYGEALDQKIAEILKQGNARAAVAFWGSGVSGLLPESEGGDQKIICNLMSGGTNPYEIELLRDRIGYESIAQVNDLHAKAYIGETQAVITSANASANGLGLEGPEQARWREAGVVISDLSAVVNWFEELWDKAQPIEDTDLAKAKKLWAKRQQQKPTRFFQDYEIPEDDVPQPLWFRYRKYAIEDDAVIRQLGSVSPEIECLIDAGAEVFAEEDKKFFSSPRWLLHFRLREDGKVGTQLELSWTYTDLVLEDIYKYKGKDQLYSCAIAAGNPPPHPFDLDDPVFKKAFAAVMNREKFTALLEKTEEEPWYVPRQPLIHDFWHDVKKEYDQLNAREFEASKH